VSKDGYENVFELAKAIVINRYRGWRNEDGEFEDSEWYLNNAKISNDRIIAQLDRAMENGIHPNTTVFIESANADIYVGLFHESYIVETDRNNGYRQDIEEHILKWDLMHEYGDGEWTEDDDKNLEVYDKWWSHRLIYMPEYDLQGWYIDNLGFDQHQCEENEDHRYKAIMRLLVKNEEVGQDGEDATADDSHTTIDSCPACFAEQLRARRENLRNNTAEKIVERLVDDSEDEQSDE